MKRNKKRAAFKDPIFDDSIGGLIGGGIRFGSAQKKNLAIYLDDRAINAIESNLDTWLDVYADYKKTPRIGAIKAALDNIEMLSAQLASALENADRFTSAYLSHIEYSAFHDVGAIERMRDQLQLLAEEVALRRGDLPRQSQKDSPIIVVELIADLLHKHAPAIAISKTEGSPFREIVETCFQAMDISNSAETAIKNLKDDRPL